VTLAAGIAASDQILRILELAIGPITTLVGTATGFYFGSASRKE